MTTKLLVVEDNSINMKLVVLLLESAGFEVLQADTASEGIALARAEQPELILMDIQLPGMDGLEATRRLKEDAITRDIKVVALTAFAMKSDQERIMEAGCDGYIAKPIEYQEFVPAVERMLTKHRN